MGRFRGVLAFGLFAAAVASPLHAAVRDDASPIAKVKNGTYCGVNVPEYKQDFFLGMPYAQPPVGPLRLNNPQSLNESFTDVRSAASFGKICVGYGSDDYEYDVDEDCLTINVIRPEGCAADAKLPVGAWIYGGGFEEGGSADQRYNLSFIVQNSVDMGKPIMGVSFNYRVSQWGFLGGKAIQAAGVTNLGIKDQRLALRWIQENIDAFGGDPSKVTIWGESAGAASVAYHAYWDGGRDEGLFRGIIAESLYHPQDEARADLYESYFQTVVKAAGCDTAQDQLDCLRQLPFDKLNDVFNSTMEAGDDLFSPYLDGDGLTELTSDILAEGKFTKTPLLLGCNTDEGTAFSPHGINTDDDFSKSIESLGPDANATAELLQLYPNDPSQEIPASYPNPPPPGDPLGEQFKRAATFSGDYAMHAPRRATAQAWKKAQVPVYSYRFNARPSGLPDYIGITHFQEVVFVFDNTNSYGYAPISPRPFDGLGPEYFDLAKLMSRMWVSFIHDQDPNGHGIAGTANWPAYADGTTSQQMVFNAEQPSEPEEDTYREEGIQFIIDNAKAQFSR